MIKYIAKLVKIKKYSQYVCKKLQKLCSFCFYKIIYNIKVLWLPKTFYSKNAQEFLKYLIVSRSPQKIENWTFIDSDDNAFLQNGC